MFANETLFEVPTPGRQRSFSLTPNRGSFPLLGYTFTLLRMPRLGLPRAHFCTNVDAAVCSHMPRLGLPRLCLHADVDAPLDETVLPRDQD